MDRLKLMNVIRDHISDSVPTDDMERLADSILQLDSESEAIDDPRCPWCGGKPNYRRKVHGHPCANHRFHNGRGW